MTGTADTEAAEFAKIYNLDVNVVPTNRIDDPARITRTWSTEPRKKSSRPSSKKSRIAMNGASRSWSARFPSKSRNGSAAYLSRNGIKHNVLNAK